MSAREHYESGVPCWVESLQSDPAAAIGFYAGLFGWDFAGPGEMPGDPPGRYFVARLRGRDVAGVGSRPPGQDGAAVWGTHISVASAEEAAERAHAAGGSVLVEPFGALPAGRCAVLRDPAGAVFCVWEPGTRHGAQLVNEPSAWAISMLHSSGPDAAAAFYAEVFGWERATMGAGGGVELLRLPGYVGGEPQQPVPRDVVAVMAPDGEGAGSYCSVDFWISDARAAAQRVSELGGRVLAEPSESPRFRTAVLADPAGAAFSVSQLLAGPPAD